jgi:ATP-dependent DNA helicase DinG
VTYIDSVFGPGGILSRSSSTYEPRFGQIALARHIDSAISGEHHALAEGPCGTGKGLAYLVPAIYHAHHSKKKIVVVTANLALQDQLMQKDLPALQAALPWPFTFTALKGKSNYACKEKVSQSEVPDDLQDWLETTTTGDKRELPVVPSDRDWSLVSATPEECVKESCEFAGDCFYYKAKQASASADITVTNIHVLAAHLSLFQTLDLEVILPPHDVLIIDEAHEVPAVMRNFFGFSVTERSVRRFVLQVRKVLKGSFSNDLETAAHRFFREVEGFASPLGARVRLVARDGFVEPLPVLDALSAIQEECVAQGEEGVKGRARARIAERAGQLFSYIAECVGQVDSESKVYWVEFSDVGRRFPRLEARPLDVGGILRKLIFDRIATVALVSATLTTTPGNFRFMRRELGVPPDAFELAVPSPFDMANQCLVVLPADRLPDDPKDPAFIQVASDVIEEVIESCGGRTLALFTSFRNLEGARDRVTARFPILVQERGSGLSKAELIRRFREEPETSLFGVESFWTGVDVVGESLTALVIDKLPFAQFDDPLIEAMKARDEEQFWKWYNASCLLKLRQGMGRLIRSVDDVGVIVLLDKRIKTKQYGKHFVKSFGPVQKSRSTADIAPFLATAKERTRANREAFRRAQESTALSAKEASEPAFVPEC